jgi:uncharacterized membrane protein (UPF0127 family)
MRLFPAKQIHTVRLGLFVLASAVLIVGIVGYVLQKRHFPTVHVHSTTIRVEIARTNSEQQKGLSGRVGLAEHHGMLFIFDQPGSYGFWMKDMQFPIDILWIEKGQVVAITPQLLPASYPAVVVPPSAVTYVLEIPAGEASRDHIHQGDTIYIDL